VGHDFTSLVRYDGASTIATSGTSSGSPGWRRCAPTAASSSAVPERQLPSQRLLASEELRDSGGALFTVSLNFYDDQPALVAGALDECRGYAFFLSGTTIAARPGPALPHEKRFYEADRFVDQARITTPDVPVRLATGNTTAFEDLGDIADPADDFNATVEYFAGPAAAALHAVDRPSHVRVFAGTWLPGRLLRERMATSTTSRT